MQSIRPTHRHLALYPSIFSPTEDEEYFRRYLNDSSDILVVVNSLVNAVTVGVGSDEVYLRKYLNDIS